MRGQKYQALIVVILLLTALPYSPFLSRASTIEKDPLAEKDIDGDGIPDPPMRDSDGDGLSDDYEIALGFDPNDFDMDDDGISDLMEEQMWDDLKNLDEIPESMEDLYDCEGDLDGDGITNCMDPDADGDGLSDQEEMMDSDFDGIPDMYENMIDHLDPNNADSDGDGIPDMDDQDPPLPDWAEEMANKNDWTPQTDSNGMAGLEGFYPLAMLAAVKFTVTCDTCEDPTSNPQYWRTVAKTIYDNGYDESSNSYTRSQWCPSPGCEQYDIDTGVSENPGYWSTGSNAYSYDYLVNHPDITSEEHQYTMTWIMPVQGYLSTSLYTNNVFIGNSVTMDSSFNLKVDGYAQAYTFTMTEYNIPENIKQAANAPNDYPSQFIEVPQFPVREGPNNDVYDLAASITAGRETDYQKAEAIMYYLRSNYYYNINGTLTPDGEDFVDYFLFGNDDTDGKCTNFASAFTILSRISGIPTRYVEGNGPGEVITPQAWQDSGYDESTGYQIQENTRIITMLNGHAYAEVLFDEIGWLTFEPTSSTTCPTCDANGGTTTGDDNSVIGNGTQPGTDYIVSDTDEDGLSDEYEIGIGTDPNNPDSDFDTLPDGAETNTGIYVNTENTGTDPLSKDTDEDGLEDDDEILCRLSSDFGKFCSHPLDSDSDNDGISDGDELLEGTNPIHHDSDNDGLTDGLELGVTGDIFENEFNSNSCATKDSANILSGCTETWQPDEDPNSTTDPLSIDSDGDGIEDGVEDLNRNGRLDLNLGEEPCNGETDPSQEDTDQGGRNDLQECENDSTNPLDPDDDINDSDGDGIFDHLEEANCIYGTAQNQCTNATSSDTDGDGVNDYDEIFNCIYGTNDDQCTDPTLEDTDGDTILDNDEITNCIYGENNDECTDPILIDTDDGGANDALEIFGDFTNPLNKNDDIQQADRDDDNDGLKNIEEDKNGNGIFEPELGETDSQDNDTDNDGLKDGDEILRNTDPLNTDTDNDDLTDGEEIYNTTWGPTNATNADTDDDGLKDGEEVLGYGTDPNVKDSDSDGINDGDEVENCQYGENEESCTNPANDDSDFDGIDDGEETVTRDTDPMDSDTDDDGIDDGVEVFNCTYGSDEDQCTNPLLWDSDGDEIDDFTEINNCIYGEDGDGCTDPTTDDSDNDGLNDWSEINNNSWGPTNPLISDTDGGGQKDGLEVLVDSTDPNDESDDDLSSFDDDGDGLTNGEEEGIYFTDPNNPDSDGDGLKDGDEVNNWSSNPKKKDSDNDGIEDGNETINCIYGVGEDECTSPTNPDSDNDGLEDGDEVNNLTTDPKNTDTDDDGLTDSTEVNNCVYGEGADTCTNPASDDSDFDGINDGDEIEESFTDPMDSDTDNDGLDDGVEVTNCIYGENGDECTDPNLSDSDGDTLSDGSETSDPMDSDTDDDGLDDGVEVTNCIYGVSENLCTDPLENDSDLDGVNDYDEIFNCAYGEENEDCTDPKVWDSDNDGVWDGYEINIAFSNPLIIDTDADGLTDGEEYSLETNLTNADSDNDTLSDHLEVNNCIYGQNNTGSDCTSPINDDSDEDGLSDEYEIGIGTDPMDTDSDGDRLTDGQEVAGQDGNGTSHGHGATNPLDNDSDNGGIRDGTEVDTDETNPNESNDDFLDALDNDSDGLSNGEELLEGTNPENPDTDGDGLSDGDEVYGLNNTYGYNSNPNEIDSDFDGVNDTVEVSNCIFGDNSDECTDPENEDSDDDGILDNDEISTCIYGENDNECTDPKKSDSDGDGIPDGEETAQNPYQTNPLLIDTDGDGLDDGDEIILGTNPTSPDSDGDGLTDLLEVTNCVYGEGNNECTNPNENDTDGDGINDYEEINNCTYGLNNTSSECTDPNDTDSDNDELNDYDEINEHNTDPMHSDSDDDGLNDKLETINLESNPLNDDSDSDGLSDYWEWVRASQGYQYSLNLNDTDADGTLDGDEDLDVDGLTNLEEINNYGTDPLDVDTDGDSLWDGDEVKPWEINKDGVNNQYNYPSNPILSDTDGDRLSDYEEVTPSNDTHNSRTDPDELDTDSDGLSDYDEIRWYWNVTGDNNTARLYYDEQGWNTSDPREENTDGDLWDDGDIDEENPVYGYFEEEDPPWGSPPSRAGTPSPPPEEAFKDQIFNWSFGPLSDPESGEPFVGLQIDAYLNETQESGSVSYKIGNGTTDSDGFIIVICNASSLSSTIKAGNWFLQLYREEQFITHEGVPKFIPAEWRDSAPLPINITGNVTIDVNVPTTAASDGTTLITGTLLEDENIPIENGIVYLDFNSVSYSGLTNENGIFTIEISTPAVEDENYDLVFNFNSNENLTERTVIDEIRIINASVELRFDEANENTFNLGEEYAINGTLFGDEGEQPTGSIELKYGDTLIGQTEITGNQAWSINFLVPSNSSWGNTILTARFSGNEIYPEDIVVKNIIIKGVSNLTLDEVSSLRTDGAQLRGNLTDHNGGAISDKIITLFLGEKSLGSLETQSDGSYAFSANLSTESSGLHEIRAVLYGSSTLSSAESVNNLTLLAIPNLLFDDSTKCRLGETASQKICKAPRGFEYNLSGTLVDELGYPMANTTVEFFDENNGFAPPFRTTADGKFNYNLFVNEAQSEIFTIDIKIETSLEQAHLLETNFEIDVIPQSNVALTIGIDNEENKAYRGGVLELSGTLEVAAGGTLETENNVPHNVEIWLDSEMILNPEINDLGLYNATYQLPDNYNLGNFNVTVKFEETDYYLGNFENKSFIVSGTTSFESVNVEGDWFNNELRRGGIINVYGILVDDLGNRIESNISVSIGNADLITTFNNETDFVSTGNIPEDYRNNRTVTLAFSGNEYLDGTQHKSVHSILVESEIRFDFEPKNVFPGDIVNVSVWLEEDDGSPIPETNITVSVSLFYDKQIEMDTKLEYNLTTDMDGFSKFSFEFPNDASSANIQAKFDGGYIKAYDDTPQQTELTIANVAISITKSPEAKEPFDINKYLPLFIGIPAALLVTAYYLYWTQKHKYEVRNLIKQMQKELNKDEDYRQIIIKSYHQLLNILDRYGFIKTKTQTVREFTDVMRTALPIPTQSVKLLTSLFEIARYSGIKPKVVDEFGMEMIDGSYNIWCVEAINNLHEVEMELNKGLKEGKVSRFTNIFGMRSS